MAYALRSACATCGSIFGELIPRNGQDCVFCAGCKRWLYNAPKTETGRKTRSISTTHDLISSSKRARILERATHRCEFCRASDRLQVGHIISVADGYKLDLPDDEINADDNLACMCEECNLGMQDTSLSLRSYMALMKRRSEW